MFDRSSNFRRATLIPRERLSNLKRVSTEHFKLIDQGAVKPAMPEADEHERHARHLATLSREREEAHAAGHAEGWQAGHEQGLADGHSQGHVAGYAKGHAEALQAGSAEIQAKLAMLDQILASCDTAVADLHGALGPTLLRMALDISRQVIRTELRLQPELIAKVVHDLLKADTASASTAMVYLHPEDAALVEQHLNDTLTEAQWRVASDPAIARGGCRVQTPYGEIDASLQTRWRQICEAAGGDLPWPA